MASASAMVSPVRSSSTRSAALLRVSPSFSAYSIAANPVSLMVLSSASPEKPVSGRPPQGRTLLLDRAAALPASGRLLSCNRDAGEQAPDCADRAPFSSPRAKRQRFLALGDHPRTQA